MAGVRAKLRGSSRGPEIRPPHGEAVTRVVRMFEKPCF